MKNVGIVTTWFERGAAYVSRQYQKTLEKSCNVFIYARGGEKYAKGDLDWDTQHVFWGKKSYLPVPMAIDKKDFLKWIKKNNIQIILFNEQQWWLPILWAKEAGIICGSYIDYYTEETIPLFSIFDFLLCNTNKHFDTFSWHPGAFYIPWGTDVELFKPTTKPGKPGQQNSRLTYFHSCGMNPKRKGTDILLDAFSRVRGEKKLVIHTQVNLSEFFPEYNKTIEKLLGSKELEIHEETVSAPGLYSLGDVYVYPSRLEGIGLTICEALACGLPVIVPDNSPMNEFIDHDCCKLADIDRIYSRADGYYWPQSRTNVESLANCMQWYLDHINDLNKFKSKARAHALHKLNWSVNSLVLQDILSKVTFSDFSNTDILGYERKRANTHYILKLKSKWPLLFYFYIFLKFLMDKLKR